MRRFATTHVPAAGEFVHLAQDVSHHMLRVTGIAPGERIELFDGSGVIALAELCSVEDGMAIVRILEHQVAGEEAHSLHLIIAQLRANVLDTVLRMSTELGVTDVTIVQAERCVARGDKRERWGRIVQSAAGQSGRSSWPTIHPPSDLRDVIAIPTGTVGRICVPGFPELPTSVVQSPQRVLIGPEGGWTEDEVDLASEQGWLPMGLGSTVLRADTAAVAAIVRCRY